MGIVYVVTNDSMPGMVKIGVTEKEDIKERLKELDNTSVPTPFRFYYGIKSDRYKEIEKLLHITFSKSRIRDKREFFAIEPEHVVAAIKISGSEEIKNNNEMIDDQGIEIKKLKLPRQQNFTFTKKGIPIGSELEFTRDPSIKCIVKNDKKVEYAAQNTHYQI